MKVHMLQAVHVDPEVFKKAQTRNPVEAIELPQRMDGKSRSMNLHPPLHFGADECLDDRSVDVFLMLDEKRLFGTVTKINDRLP